MIEINNSQKQSFNHCRRQWYLGYYRELEPKIPSFTDSLATGTRVHAALARYYQVQKDTDLYEDNMYAPIWRHHRAIVESDWSRMLATYKKHTNDEPPEEVIAQFNKVTELESIMLEGYEEWLEETGADFDIKEIVGVEETLSATLPLPDLDIDVTVVGTLDLRYRNHSDGTVVMDHKTVASFDKRVKLLPLNEQFKMYLMLSKIDLQHKNPEHQEIVSTGELSMLRKVKRTATAKPPFYMRAKVWHGSETMDSFVRQLTANLTDIMMARYALDGGVHHDEVAYPTPNDYCESCPFFVPCQMMDDGSRWDAYLEDHFTRKEETD